MSNTICPGCKTSKYNNPKLKLLVNICGHFLCDSCVEIMFVRGSGMCPECKTPLRRNNFREQLFESSFVEKEVDIRKRILKDFNKRQEDFQSLDEYNNYLEFVEEIIFNLTNNIDVEETKRKIEEYKTVNKDKIRKNKSRYNTDLEELEMLIMEEEELKKKSNEDDNKVLENHKRQRLIKEKLIDDLMTSSASASAIVAQHVSLISESSADSKSDDAYVKKESTIDSMGKSFIKYASLRDKAKSSGSTISMDVLPEVAVAAPFVYREYQEETLGPPLPENLEEHALIIRQALPHPSEKNLLIAGFSHNDWASVLLQRTYCGLFL